MQNFISIWTRLDLKRRAIIIVATLAVFFSIIAMTRISSTPQMALLFAGLDGKAAGTVITALDQRGVPYEVRGDSIHVDITQRDSLRMSLAGEGLPTNSGAGYELLDSLSGFGTTSEMFDVAYWRAKEGELARTILALPEVRAARVHISQGLSDPFRRNEHPTASITVTTNSGLLSSEHAAALRNLVSAAVSGMRPEDVQVIDTVGGLVTSSSATNPSLASTAFERSEEIRRSVERLLAARVGPNKAVVEVAVELITEHEQVNQRTFDPQGRVLISSDIEENSSTNQGNDGSVTVASNLPDGDANNNATNQSQSNQTREKSNFEVSETKREIMRVPGGIKRLSVAVLVDGMNQAAADGTITRVERPAEELTALHELVASAVGLDTTRGDILTLKSMAFELAPQDGSTATPPLLPSWFGSLDPLSALQLAALSALALVLGLFVLRPMLISAPATALGSPSPDQADLSASGISGEISDDFTLPELPVMDFSSGLGTETEEPADRLRRLIQERQAESIEILRGWLEPEEERA